MHRAAQFSQATSGSNSNTSQRGHHRNLHITASQHHSWTITPPREPSAHPHASPTTPPPPTPTDGHHLTPLSRDLRTLMRLLPHSVVVCTSTSPSNPKTHRPPTPRAMTMSSFTSLALTPTPVVSFNISVPSRTYDAVEATRRFNIHVLADDVNGARIADWLAKGNAGGRKVFETLEKECECTFLEGGTEGEPPVLKGEGVLYVLRCRLLEEPDRGLVRVRDHVIVLGEVIEILEGGAGVEGEREGKRKRKHERFGLLYADRRYRQLGNCITPAKDHG
ncbi:flavin reductase like domain-containing protein [Immersiella caudata]|uniref:Flavin reductase like domain-containing protein n=1 Tax=Immersiella caudata TaxID=314043 RepID=A0AA40C6H7_9PEZI|nr:flavin reductase like domain-containing protein [Immersiella caudata]